jgi:uncharacterized protein
MSKELTLIIKTVERCNINCKYCYFFNSIDKSYETHPPYILPKTIDHIAKFIYNAINCFDIDSIIICFHGGEPMMQKQDDFENMCSILSATVKSKAHIYFSIQTNGMLITEKWVNIFLKYDVQIGISLDGPEKYNDKDRIDNRGKGTYHRVVRNIEYYNQQAHQHKPLSILCVINPEHDPCLIYKHFTENLGINRIDFLLLDNNYNHLPSASPDKYGKYLCSIFKQWKKSPAKVYVRFITSILQVFLNNNSLIYGTGPTDFNCLPLLTIASNGNISPVDELRTADPALMETKLNVKSHSLSDCINHSNFQYIKNAEGHIPKLCQPCCWSNVCHGGALVNRYSDKNKFDNPSIYCDGLKLFYTEVANYLLEQGLSYAQLENLLQIN